MFGIAQCKIVSFSFSEAQHALQYHVRSRGITTQLYVPNKQNMDWSLESFHSDKTGTFIVKKSNSTCNLLPHFVHMLYNVKQIIVYTSN